MVLLFSGVAFQTYMRAKWVTFRSRRINFDITALTEPIPYSEQETHDAK